jgi:hypothetical protein
MHGSEPSDASPPYAPLLETAYGALRAQILCVAAELGLAERLAQNGPVTASELAPKLGVDAVVLERVLRGLVSMNVCDEIEGSRFRLTALGEYLRPNHPDSVEARVLLHGQVFYRMWGELAESVRTGEGGSQLAFGMPSYEYFITEPQVGLLFDRTMASEGPFRHRPAVEAYDFGQFATVVDVGGGSGALMAEILKAYSQPAGIGSIYREPRPLRSRLSTPAGSAIVAVSSRATLSRPYPAAAMHTSSPISLSVGRMIKPSSYCETAGRRLPKTAKFCSSNGLCLPAMSRGSVSGSSTRFRET